MPDLKQTLQKASTIAVIGCSDKPHRTSNKIAGYLKESGYRIIPVNPNIETACGERAYPNLSALPEEVQLDIVDIFRAPDHTAEMVKMITERCATTGEEPTVWTQLGVSSGDAKQRAKDAELPYVENRCIMVEHGRLLDKPKAK